MKTKKDLTKGSILSHLIKLTIPGIGGMMAIIIFNITDTYFVSKLGTEPLAAMGFTFPIIMIIGSIAMGLSMGSSSLISRAIGSNDHSLSKRTATDSLILSILAVFFISSIGILTIKPVFSLLGAKGNVLSLVKDYMFIWYLGAVVSIMPPVGDGCLRATGDMIRPFFVMVLCASMNIVFDIILIFGKFGFPAMGIKGAAIATISSRFLGMLLNLYFLHFHSNLIDFKIPSLKKLINSWKNILNIGLPAAFSQILMPISQGIMTWLASSIGGSNAVAAIAAGSRIESFVLIIPIAFGIALMPITGQNWGAKKEKRIHSIRIASNRFSLIMGSFTVLLFLCFSKHISSFFTNSKEIINMISIYLIIIGISHFGIYISLWTNQIFTAIGKSNYGALFNTFRVFFLFLPFAFIGKLISGYSTMLTGIALSNIIAGIIAIFLSKRILNFSFAKSNL